MRKSASEEQRDEDKEVSFENASLKLPKKGTISFKLAYPKKGNRNREESFEVFLNDGGKILWQYDMVAEGDVGKDWSYVEYSYGYELEKELTTILFKTHSAKGSKGTLFGIGDIIVTDAETNEQYKMDLTDADTQVTCRAGDFMTNRVTDCEYEILELNQ